MLGTVRSEVLAPDLLIPAADSLQCLGVAEAIAVAGRLTICVNCGDLRDVAGYEGVVPQRIE